MDKEKRRKNDDETSNEELNETETNLLLKKNDNIYRWTSAGKLLMTYKFSGRFISELSELGERLRGSKEVDLFVSSVFNSTAEILEAKNQ